MKIIIENGVWLFTLAASACLLQYFWNGFLDVGRTKWRAGGYLMGLFYFFLSTLWHLSGLSPAPQGLRGAFLLFLAAALFWLSCRLFPGFSYNSLYLSITFVCINQLCYMLSYALSSILTRLVFGIRGEPAGEHFFETPEQGVFYLSLFVLIIIFLQFVSFRRLRSGVVSKNLVFQRHELPFLIYPGLSGLLFGILMREITSFVGRDGQMYHLMVLAPVFNLLFPLALTGTLGAILTTNQLLQRLRQMYDEKSEHLVLVNQLSQMQDHIRELENLYSGVRSMKHDIRKHLCNLQALLRNAAPEARAAADEYLSRMEETLERLESRFQTGNPVTDVILNGKYQEAREKHILYTCEFLFPSSFGISAFDIGIILDNGLENALEACKKAMERLDGLQPYIHISGQVRESMFLIVIENSYDGTSLVMDEYGLPLTTKRDHSFHGIGLRNIHKCASKYFGDVECSALDNRFVLMVMLQKREQVCYK